MPTVLLAIVADYASATTICYRLGGICLDWATSSACYRIDLEDHAQPVVSLPSLPRPIFCGAAVRCEDKIFYTGGITGTFKMETREVQCLDLTGERWRTVAPMLDERRRHVALTCNGLIYVLGGFDSSAEETGRCEVYHPRTNEWKRLPSMTMPRTNHTGVVFNNRLYVFGDICEYLDTCAKTLEWKQCANTRRRMWHRATALRGGAIAVVAIGTSTTTAVELYNPVTDSWSSADWQLPRAFADDFIIHYQDGKVYILHDEVESCYYTLDLDLGSTVWSTHTRPFSTHTAQYVFT